MPPTKVSVAAARQNFARLIKRAERGSPIEITRHGESVAVLLSASEYAAITGKRSTFMTAALQIRERLHVEELDIDDSDFEGLRDESPGREVSI